MNHEFDGTNDEHPTRRRRRGETRAGKRVAPTLDPPADDAEAYATLCSLAESRSRALPPEMLARHVLSVTEGADWPVRRAALDALLRRLDFARRDGLRISSRPARGPYGTYETRRAKAGARPYRTRLDSLDPPRGSCDCPDYLRGSLALCKHLLVILQDSSSRRRRKKNADPAPTPLLSWDPVRPLLGAGDWLERVRLDVHRNGASAPLTRWFDEEGRLRDALADEPRKRKALVEKLSQTARDPAVRALLAEERERLGQAARGVDLLRAMPASLRTLRRPLYPYQVEGVRRFLSAGRLLLADDMGLGKTAQATAACHVLWKAGEVRRGLLVVPNTLKPQWLREWALFSDTPVAIVEGSPADRARTYRRTRTGFLVANYEQLLRDLPLMHSWRPDIVVLDEAQRIKNWATKTATYVKQLAPTYRLVLTGTPMENRLDELASILDWVDDRALQPKWRLVPWHVTYADGRRESTGARHLDTLRVRLAPCMLRRVRAEVLAQLPRRTDTRVPVELTPEQRAAHEDLDGPIARLLANARRRPLTQPEFLRLMTLLMMQRMICSGMALYEFRRVWPELAMTRPDEAELRRLASPKLRELRELIAAVAVTQRRKIVVFSQWRRMLRLAHWAVADLLAENGARALFFTGEEGAKRRTQNIVDFHDDPAARVLLATDAGGVGLNLQRAASCCVNLELPWNPAILEQRIGRIYRLGQRNPVEVYNVVCEEGIEARIAGLVADKRALFKGLFDGGSDEVLFERSASFLSRIEEFVRPAAPPPLSLDEETADPDAADAEPFPEESGEPSVAATTDAESTDAESVSVPVEEITAVLGRLDLRAAPDGGVTITAPREAAAALGAVLLRLARHLGATSPPS